MGLIKYQARHGRPAFLDTFFDDFFTRDRFFNEMANANRFVPAANIAEGESAFTIELSVPGFEKSDFSIEVNKGVLSVKGSHKQHTETPEEANTRSEDGKPSRYALREFATRGFVRSFNLPETVDSEHIEANYTNGVLSLKLPKRNELIHPAKKIEIK